MSNRPQHWDRPLADLGQPPTSLERPSASQRQPAANWEHDPPDSARAAVHGSYGSIVPQAPDGDQYGPTRFHAQPTHSYTQPTRSCAQPAHSYVQLAHSYAQPTHSYTQPTRFYAQPPGAMLPQSPHVVPPPSIPIALPPLSDIMRSRPPDPLSASLPLSVMPGVMSAPTSAAVAGLVVRAVTRHDIENPPQRTIVPPLQLRREEPQLGTEAAHPTEPRQHRTEDPPRRYADQPPSRHLEHPPHHVEHPPRRREPKLWQIILPTSKILPEHMDLLTGIIRKRADLAVLAGLASPLHTVVFSPDIDLAGLLRFYRMALPESNQVFLAGSPLSSCQVYLGRDLCQKRISAHRLRDGDYDYHVKIGQRHCAWIQCRFSVSLDTEDENAYLTLCAHMAARHFEQTPMCPLCRRVLRVPKDAEWEAYDLIKKHFMTGLCLELAKHAINTVAKPVPRPFMDADDGLAPLTTGSGRS